jgi:hypothetical protein
MDRTRANHLKQWADEADARNKLPLLIRRLIRNTVASLANVNLPADEQVQRPGFDGVVETAAGNEFVPIGRSVWEMGTDKNPHSKAGADFARRTTNTSLVEKQNSVFIFVTPREWQKKDEWAKERASQSDWRGVLVYDANDLEHWLDIAPNVDIWFSHLTNRVPSDVQDIGFYWASLRAISDPPLAPLVFLNSRDAQIEVVRKWISDPADSLFVQTDGLTDGIDFLAALAANGEPERLQDGLIVYSVEAWRSLIANGKDLFLIAAPMLELRAPDAAGAVAAGHHVFVSGPRGIVDRDRGIQLERLDHHQVYEALIETGYSEAQAMSFAKGCGGSSSILKRVITKHPDTTFPEWCRTSENRTLLAPFAIAGGWRDVNPDPPKTDFLQIGSPPPIDALIVSELVGLSRNDIQRVVNRWRQGGEPLFIQIGDSILVLSREDAWYLLGGSLSRTQVERFADFAELVLSENNPAFQLPSNERWLASIKGKAFSISEDLRRSIVESLALMTCYRTLDAPATNVNFADTVHALLGKVLPENSTWERWASLGYNLTLIAEADPEFVLNRVEEDLKSQSPALPELFAGQTGYLSSHSNHCHLLWALETLAWSPEYLKRVAVILAKLTPLIPKEGPNANRPDNSFREIFVLWLPHTTATVEQRLAALASVIESAPEPAWNLLRELLPSGITGVTHTTHMPRWRSWADGWSRDKVHHERVEYAIGVANIVTQSAGMDPARWADVIGGMLRFNSEITAQVLDQLEAIAQAKSHPELSAFRLWKSIRDVVARHQRHEDAEWAFTKQVLDRLSVIRDLIEPIDPVFRYEWLFDYQAELSYSAPEDDVTAHDNALRQARINALKEIVSKGGVSNVFRLLEHASNAPEVGWILGNERLLTTDEMRLPSELDSNDVQRLRCIGGFIQGCYHRDKWDFVHSLPINEWSPTQIAFFGRALPFSGDTWEWLKSFSAEAQNEYWKNAYGYLRSPSPTELRAATRSLIKNGRPFSSIDLTYSALSQKVAIPSDQLAEVLEAALEVKSAEDPAQMHNVRYDTQRLIKVLQEDPSFDKLRLARIEWGFLSLLQGQSTDVRPDVLMRELEAEPQLFVDMLRAVYRGEGEPNNASTSDLDWAKARHASDLLDELDRLPGRSADGVLDISYLREWLMRAKALASESGHSAVCDLTIGRIIARDWRKTASEEAPATEIVHLLEDSSIGTDEVFRGFVNGVINSRGIVCKSPFDGGQLERAQADRCRALAQTIRGVSSRFANAFDILASYYDSHAQREDEDAQRVKLGRW